MLLDGLFHLGAVSACSNSNAPKKMSEKMEASACEKSTKSISSAQVGCGTSEGTSVAKETELKGTKKEIKGAVAKGTVAKKNLGTTDTETTDTGKTNA